MDVKTANAAYLKERKMSDKCQSEEPEPKLRSLGDISGLIKGISSRLVNINVRASHLRRSLIDFPDANKVAAKEANIGKQDTTFLFATLHDLGAIRIELNELESHLDALENGCNWRDVKQKD